jgi:type I restriction enzyme S subunit
MVRLDQLATFEMGQSPDSKFVIESDEGIPFLQGCAEFGAITPNYVVSCTRPKKTCQPGDILISIRAPVGDLNKADREYCIGRGLAAVRFNDGIASNFGWHLLKFWSSSLRIVAQGSTFEAIGRYELTNLQVCYVHLSEQRRIAEILDTIDEAIQKTEALISKLKAMKQGLLHDLLTRGLDENGKLRDPKAHPEQFKDSPFGLVPVDWDVVNLGVLSTLITSGSRGWASLYSNQGALFLRISNLTREHVNLRLDDVQYVLPPPTAAEGKRTRVDEGDLLISITADLGIIGIIPGGLGEAYVNQHIALIRLDRKSANPYWVANYLAFGATQKQFYMLNDQGAKAGMNLPTVESLEVAVPEVQEQNRIAALITAYDARIRTEEQYRDKLKLQKKGLMHDLLTGKVRVKT